MIRWNYKLMGNSISGQAKKNLFIKITYVFNIEINISVYDLMLLTHIRPLLQWYVTTNNLSKDLLVLWAVLDETDKWYVVEHTFWINWSSSEHLIYFLVSQPGTGVSLIV